MSVVLLFIAKFIGISSPFILRSVVNGLTASYGTALATGSTVAATSGSFTLVKVCGAIGLWGLTRLM
jgi:ATP-binding cassette, subfamily B, heavy metal transporter